MLGTDRSADIPASDDYLEDPQVAGIFAELMARFGGSGDSIEAIVLYGSFTRGQQDTLLDFYVLLRDLEPLPRWQRVLLRVLPPNVYYVSASGARAKVAVLTLDALERAVSTDLAPYFWARFAQPCVLVYSANMATTERFERLVCRAAERLMAAASVATAGVSNSADFWERTFSLTYSTELRPEQSSRYAALYQANADYFDRLHAALPQLTAPPQSTWRMRRLAGKTLSFLRLSKSAFTFDDPVDYILWKVARHSGVTVTATPKQKRYPLIFGWPLVWELYRRGAFK
ncbi:MAG: hypothetical protein R3E82_17325 [Pseudomonadales bacterium]|nr:hypothetical protein [Pseudomonadales bacterium]